MGCANGDTPMHDYFNYMDPSESPGDSHLIGTMPSEEEIVSPMEESQQIDNLQERSRPEGEELEPL